MSQAVTIDTTTRRAVLTGGAALAVIAPFAAHAASPDAALVRMCEEYVAGVAEELRLIEPYYDRVCFEYPPEVQERIGELAQSGPLLRDMIAHRPAVTHEGLRAKARALLTWMAPGGPDDAPFPGDDDHLAYSLARDLVGGVA